MSLVLEHKKTQKKTALAGETMVAGRDDGCEIALPDASVSRRHCAFHQANGVWTVEDLGSRNGTVVDGVKLEKGARVPIAAGAALTIGTVEFVVRDAPKVKKAEPKPRLESTAFGIEDLIERRRDAEGRSIGQVLFKAQQALYPGQPIDTLIDGLLRVVLEFVPATRASVQLVNPETNEVEPSLTLDQQGETLAHSKDFLMSGGVRDKVLSERKCVLIRDVKNDAVFNGRVSLVGGGITSAIAAPIFDGGDILGIVYADIRDGTEELSEDDATVVSMLASFGGTMLSAAHMVTALMQSEAALLEENEILKERLRQLDPVTTAR
jgi:adenylate cyclase